MSEIGPLAGLLALIGAVLTFLGVLISQLYARINRLEDKLDLLSAENNRMWRWARSLLDYGYRYRRPEAPEPPSYEDTLTRQDL